MASLSCLWKIRLDILIVASIIMFGENKVGYSDCGIFIMFGEKKLGYSGQGIFYHVRRK